MRLGQDIFNIKGYFQDTVKKFVADYQSKVGRFLHPKEVVDHKNGVKHDNRIENLALYSSNSEHLKETLNGRVPNWSEDGLRRIREGSAESKKVLSETCFLGNLHKVLLLLQKTDHSKTDVQELQRLRKCLRGGMSKKQNYEMLLEIPPELLLVLFPRLMIARKNDSLTQLALRQFVQNRLLGQ